MEVEVKVRSMQRCIEWTRRYATGAPGGLGFGAELWADVSAHPAAARLQALARTHRWNFDAGDVRYRITRPLLLDVIHAACGIEYTVEKLLAAIDEVQRSLDDTWQDLEPAEISVSAERWDVSFEVSNLVVWVRTLVERLETKTRVGEWK